MPVVLTRIPPRDRLTKIGDGGYRMVYALDDDRVVKFEYSDERGSECGNSTEIDVWTNLTPEQRDSGLFARILEFHPECEWIIMERVEAGPIWEHDLDYDDTWIRARDDIKQRLNEMVPDLGIYDVQTRNIGRRKDGTYCLVDYGCADERYVSW